MATLPTPKSLRVLVASDYALVADTIRVALTSHGHEVVVIRWSGDARPLPRRRPQEGGSLMEVGLLISDLDRWSRIDGAASVVARTSVPWLVITSAPRGPAWGALLAAGVELVLPRDIGLEPISDLLESVGLRRLATPADERTELQAAWEETRAHHRRVAERVGGLSPREREVLRLTYEGYSVARIAETLKVGPSTVRRRVRALLHKLDVPTKLVAVATFGESLDEFDTRPMDGFIRPADASRPGGPARRP